ncbi:nucleoside phosphorylase domain-containing protein [Penicillium hispanicum]|uniref:nucleoside phosphorylase domain-containing protein n=1 Tax=Penicillium hispanicum TaxID=1080232 RepID=UPI00253F8B4E|nr:nucleoside phosphorylase domain-containing protein [Penicillium hispanicum]KAJ5594593.1 nucleoside phosphorylase domain-containing protein [Penicillium hispanicum]
MGDSSAQRTYRSYTIGWICALSVEMAVAKGMLDEIHQRLPPVRGDSNVYTLGSICGHNVVLACLPAGVYGTSSASNVATQMLSTFPSIRFSLLVGIGGGVPGGTADVRLGDIVVSKPTGIFGGVIQYDYGKTVESGRFQRTGALNKPPSILLTALASLEADQLAGFTRIPFYLSQMHQRYPSMAKFTHPGPETDILFKARYYHADATDGNCSQCSPGYLIYRKPRLSTDPSLHCGLREEILCFEMEAAGIMDHMPSLVIRGICDYADSHKNKQWQPYAAATAAAFAKELLSVIPARKSRGNTDIK